MKLSLALLGLAATHTICTPAAVKPERAAVEGEVHPYSLGITSPLYDPSAKKEDLESSPKKPDTRQSRRDAGLVERAAVCDAGGRGNGIDYDYGCTGGWCWRNCNGPWHDPFAFKKEWCWLKYSGGNGGWTPCGGWKDCEWSYNNKNAKCAKGNCKSCGCGC